MTSHTTFEDRFRHQLLDLVYGQWAILGAPYSVSVAPLAQHVIDPEGLLWCSLEFLPTEPRLTEAVLEWLCLNEDQLVRQRIHKHGRRGDPRSVIWRALDARPTPAAPADSPSETCHGLLSARQVTEFAQAVSAQKLAVARDRPRRIGGLRFRPATLLLRARDIIGHDVRHFLLIYLLANPQGGRLRDIQDWSGYSYRSLFDAATRWTAAEIATIDSGYCRLTTPENWRSLLRIDSAGITLVKWQSVFETCIRLLRDLAKARSKGLGEDSHVFRALLHQGEEALQSSLPLPGGDAASPVRGLLNALAHGSADQGAARFG